MFFREKFDNVKIINFTRIMKSMIVLWPVIILIYLSKGLSFFEVGILNSIGSIIIAIMEVPLGIFADRLGRRKNLVIGYFLNLIFIITLCLGKTFTTIMISEIIFSIATCFISGTDSSILYDSLKKYGKENEYSEILSKNSSRTIFISIFISIIATYLYQMNKHLIYIISIAIYFIIFLSVFFIKESDIYKEEGEDSLTKFSSFGILKFSIVTKYKTFIFLSLFSSLMILLASNLDQFTSPILISHGLELKYTGFIIAGSKVLSIILLRNREYILNIFKEKTFMIITLLTGIILTLLLLIDGLYYWIVVISVVASFDDFVQPIIAEKINAIIDSRNRTTMLSISSLLDNAFFTIGDPAFGYGVDRLGYSNSYGVFGVVMLVGTVICERLRKNRS